MYRTTILTAVLALAATGLLATTGLQIGNAGGDDEEKKAAKKPAAEKPAEKPAAKPASAPAKGGDEGEEEVRPKKGLTGPVDLSKEAKGAWDPRIKAVFEKYVVAHDVITLSAGGAIDVVPLAKKFDPADMKTISYKTLKDGVERTLSRDSIATIAHYEYRVLDAAKQLQQSGLDRPSGGQPAVPRSRVLKAAEMLLVAGQRFHTEGKGKIRVDGWLGLDDVFKNELQIVHVSQLRALTGEGDWDGGEALGQQLREVYKPTKDLTEAIEAHYVALADALMDKNQHPTARDRIEFWQKKYGTSETPAAVLQVHKRLQDRARALVQEAQAAKGQKDASKALNALQQAEAVWPRLAGIAELRNELLKDRPVLRVGVRQLPTQISPTTAMTDVDHAACQLVYDTLYRLRSAPSSRDGYECKLGLEIRQISQGGWDITLPSDLKWSDGKPFTTEDIRRSFEIYTDRRSPYYDPLVDINKDRLVRVQTDDDYHLTITFERGHLDPLSFLTFPLLPAARLPRERNPVDTAFGKTPLGTGPYVFKGIQGNEAVFEANEHYRRPHAPNGPALKEIRFVQYSDFQQAKQNVANGVWQVLFHLTSKERDEMESIANVQLLTPTRAREGDAGMLTNPRIWFLLPNHRGNLANIELRKAITMCIDREAILNEVFRGKEKSSKDHEQLNGPFPLHSWAYDPGALPPSTPYKPQVGEGHRQRAGNIPTLNLLVPSDDPSAAEACERIKNQLAAKQIPITVQPMSRTDLLLELNKVRPTFDLLYMKWDFPNETLDLWPLFDTQGVPPNGRNYMGYTDDKELPGDFRTLQSRRDWSVVRTFTHGMHSKIVDKSVAFVPLWQLDHHVAVHKSLRFTRLHPLFVFDDPEEWRLVFGN
jgi:peptide/nickel transport system substrate-binding protein